VDATNGGVGKLAEGSEGDGEIPKAGATGASVGNGKGDRTALERDGQIPAADGIAVRDIQCPFIFDET
jgi:hypothetical protein